MTNIHPSAVIDPNAKIAKTANIGPFCVIGPEVTLHDNVLLKSHVNIEGLTEIGAGCKIYPFASLGTNPQDLKYKGEKSQLIIGENCRIREHVTMNTGTEGGGMITRVGANCLFMVGVHIAHDCQVGDHVIIANNGTLGGHVIVEDYAIIGGLAAIHQYVRIGAHAMIGGMTGVEGDVLPFTSVSGERGKLTGLNVVGLRRRAFTKQDIAVLRLVYGKLFSQESTLAEKLPRLKKEYADNDPVQKMLDFVNAQGQRGLTLPRD